MRKFTLLTAIFCNSFLIAQIKTPQASPTATITQKVGISNISVEYSRPGVKEREIFGELVPYGKIWRTGANKATKITFEEDVIFGGQRVKKGSYSLFTIPNGKAWKVLLNSETELWGAGDYDEGKEVYNQTIELRESSGFVESFTIDFGTFKDFSAVMSLKWANTVVEIKIKTMSSKKIMNQYLELLTKGPSAKFYADNSNEPELALDWINIAIEKKPEAFWMLYHKARILKIMGKKNEAINTANAVIDIASGKKEDYGYIRKSKDLITSIKSKK